MLGADGLWCRPDERVAGTPKGVVALRAPDGHRGAQELHAEDQREGLLLGLFGNCTSEGEASQRLGNLGGITTIMLRATGGICFLVYRGSFLLTDHNSGVSGRFGQHMDMGFFHSHLHIFEEFHCAHGIFRAGISRPPPSIC